MSEPDRFRDDGRTVYDFLDEVLVVCPRCSGRAVVRPLDAPDVPAISRWSVLRRITCGSCAYTREQTKKTIGTNTIDDPYFGLPLWLRAEVDGHQVWAFNLEHVDYLQRCVMAKLRERAPVEDRRRPQTLIERLPAWFLAASSRDRMSKALEQMRARAA